MSTTTETKTHDELAVDRQVVLLDPQQLAAHPSNVRTSLRDLRGLVRSIKATGILVPLVVVRTDDGGHQIVAGHRRCAAAIEAGLDHVPCLVRDDLDDARQVAAMLVENTQREGLSGAEEAAGYEQLAVLGMSEAGIAKATGTTRKHVQKARRVAASEVASTVAGRYDLTLDQALVIAEFDDDRDVVKELAVIATRDPGQFEHLASRRRQDRERAAQRGAAVEALEASGARVVTETERYNDHPRAASLQDLVDSGGTPFTAENHAGCPGHCAVVHDWQPTDPSYYCLEPAKHGHRSRYGSGRPKGRMTEEQKAERRQVVENNKAWKAAEPVRRAYIQQLLTARKPPTGVLRYTVTEILAAPDQVGDGDDDLLAELVGVESNGGYGREVGRRFADSLSNARVPLGLLAQVAADNEHAMGVQTWRQRSPRAARWLSFLASIGYSLSDIEQHVVDQAATETDVAGVAQLDDPVGSEADVGEPAGQGEAEVIPIRSAAPPGYIDADHAATEADPPGDTGEAPPDDVS